jgi:steroid delta-isomerase-like uncharacterized protein
VARAAFEAVDRQDLDAIVALVAPDGVDDVVAVGEFRGPQAIRGFFAETFAAFPDFTMTIDRMVVQDSTVVVQWHAEGTFSGQQFQGIAPTGRRVEMRGVDVMEIHEGRLHHNTIYYDGLSMARQIGLLPAKDSGADRALIGAFNTFSKVRSKLG